MYKLLVISDQFALLSTVILCLPIPLKWEIHKFFGLTPLQHHAANATRTYSEHIGKLESTAAKRWQKNKQTTTTNKQINKQTNTACDALNQLSNANLSGQSG